MPTTPKVRKAIIKMLPSNINGLIYELGCGFGFLALRLAKKCPTAQVIAFEKALVPYLIAKIVSLFASNLHVKREDFLTLDLTRADYLICYLFPHAMEKLSKMSLKGILITHTFRLPGHKVDKVYKVNDLYSTQINRYIFG